MNDAANDNGEQTTDDGNDEDGMWDNDRQDEASERQRNSGSCDLHPSRTWFSVCVHLFPGAMLLCSRLCSSIAYLHCLRRV